MRASLVGCASASSTPTAGEDSDAGQRQEPCGAVGSSRRCAAGTAATFQSRAALGCAIVAASGARGSCPAGAADSAGTSRSAAARLTTCAAGSSRARRAAGANGLIRRAADFTSGATRVGTDTSATLHAPLGVVVADRSVIGSATIRVGLAEVVGWVEGIGLTRVHLPVLVGVFLAVADATLIGVDDQDAGLRCSRVSIRRAFALIGVGCGVFAVTSVFGAVKDSVSVAVFVEGVDLSVAVMVVRGIGFLAVGYAVVVAVSIVGIRAELLLEFVGEAVLVGVGDVAVISAVAGGGVSLAWVHHAVLD